MSVEDVLRAYPARFYADLNKPCGWYDMAMFSSVEGLPALSELFALTPEQWLAKGGSTGTSSKAVINNELVDYVQPVVLVPLKTQASYAQAWIQQQANLASAMGEVFTTDMRTYVKAIASIVSGVDTTSTELPTPPTDIFTTAS